MTTISNKLRAGFADSVTATTPTLAFLTSAPVYGQLDKPRYLYEEAGLGDSSYSGEFVESEGVIPLTVSMYLTPSIAYRIFSELSGLAEPTGAVTGTNTKYTFASGSPSPAPPSYSLLREFSMFLSDGTTHERITTVLTGATITGAVNSMITVELNLLGHSPTNTSITFPNANQEDTAASKFSTAGTSLTATGNNAVVEGDINSFTITLSATVTELKAKLNNKYRYEGGSYSAMVAYNSTAADNVKTMWRNSTPNTVDYVLKLDNGSREIEFSLKNCFMNERTVSAPLNEVIAEDTTWTSAPFDISSSSVQVPTANNIVTT